MALVWRGEQVKAELRRAARVGADETMAAAVDHAQANHGGAPGRFTSRSGELVAGTKIVERSADERGGTRGRWGVTGPAAAYAARIEFGFQGKDSLGRIINTPELPFLRPAATAAYPGFAGRIRRAGSFA